MEEYIYSILNSKKKKRKVIMYIVIAFVVAIMMIPTKLVLAKMLPGKSANTFSIYVDTPENSSAQQTSEVTSCILEYFKKEQSVMDMEVFLAQGAPLDYAGLVKGSSLKSMAYQAEIVVNLSDKHERGEVSYNMVHRVRPEVKRACSRLIPDTVIKFVEMPSGPPTMATIVVSLFGKNPELTRKTAKTIADIFERTEGLVDIDIMQDSLYEKFEIIPLNMIQGVSILEGEILIVDEVQLVTREYMSMILSRMSEGSKLFLLGDIHQTYSTIQKQDSGLFRLQQVLPHEALAWVDLKNIYRNKHQADL